MKNLKYYVGTAAVAALVGMNLYYAHGGYGHAANGLVAKVLATTSASGSTTGTGCTSSKRGPRMEIIEDNGVKVPCKRHFYMDGITIYKWWDSPVGGYIFTESETGHKFYGYMKQKEMVVNDEHYFKVKGSRVQCLGLDKTCCYEESWRPWKLGMSLR